MIEEHGKQICLNGFYTPDTKTWPSLSQIEKTYEFFWQLKQSFLYFAKHTYLCIPLRFRIGSYSLKHVIEHDAKAENTGYHVCNGVVILAATILGMEIEIKGPHASFVYLKIWQDKKLVSC